MRETYSTIRHLLHLATELDRACALFLTRTSASPGDEACPAGTGRGLAIVAPRRACVPAELAAQHVIARVEKPGESRLHRTAPHPTEDARSSSLSLTTGSAHGKRDRADAGSAPSRAWANIWDTTTSGRSFECFSGRKLIICRAVVLRAKPHRRKTRPLI